MRDRQLKNHQLRLKTLSNISCEEIKNQAILQENKRNGVAMVNLMSIYDEIVTLEQKNQQPATKELKLNEDLEEFEDINEAAGLNDGVAGLEMQQTPMTYQNAQSMKNVSHQN